ncbi:MAG: MOSC domain-containing protein [Acidobacteriota bacterium]|nr:MAG: MOSC domain-containing protein [Acidobacteriota bacterium]
MARHLSAEELVAGLELIRGSARHSGTLEMIVRRPFEDAREELEEGDLDLELGLVGDNWKTRGSSRTDDGFGHPDMQLNVMNSRAIALIAGTRDRWKLAGDQLYIDLDLSDENLPHGSRLSVGAAVIEITEIPHNGCRKFADRFGVEAVKFVNSAEGKRLHLRGVNAKVIVPGKIRVSDVVSKI